MISVLFQELGIGICLTLPIVWIGSHCEKRYLVGCKRPIPYCQGYRIVCLLLLFTSIHLILPKSTSQTEDIEIVHIICSVLRYGFIICGIHLGQAYCPIAITGSIATGKSTVVQILLEKYVDHLTMTNMASTIPKQRMFRIIDTDKIGHDILLSPSRLSLALSSLADNRLVHSKDSVYNKIIKTFGDQQNANKLGDIIFQDRSKRQMLNRITHPQIIRILIQQLLIGSYLRKELWICADVPLLFESSYTRYLFGCIVVVACAPDLQYERLRKRNLDLTETQCRQRIASQIPIEQKVARADIVIWNNGTYDDLAISIDEATNELQRRMQLGQFSWILYFVMVTVGLFLYVSFIMYY